MEQNLIDPENDEFVQRTRKSGGHQLETSEEAIESRQLVADFARPTYLTFFLIGILVLVHVYVMSLDSSPGSSLVAYSERDAFYNDYANDYQSVLDGEYYRLLTSMFLHADPTHLFFNCFGLYIFGKVVETLFGRGRFLAIYFLGGLTGSVASFSITHGASIGASGAIFAVFGAVAAYFYLHRKLYGKVAYQQLRSLAFLAVINLGIGLLSNVPGSNVRIDNAAHIGGALGGLILALAISPRYQFRTEINLLNGSTQDRLFDTYPSWLWLPVSFVFAIILAAIFGLALLSN